MSKGYWVVRAKVKDSENYSKYIDLATYIIGEHKGKFLVRGGQQTEYENSGFERSVVIEFETYKDALECYESENYQKALKFVEGSASRLVSIVEGI